MKFKGFKLLIPVIILSAFVLTGIIFSDLYAAKKEEPKPKVLAKIGDRVITEADLDAELEQIPVYARKRFLKKEGKKDILDKMVKDELLYQAALDMKLDQDPEIKRNLENMKKRILSNAYFTQYIRDDMKSNDEKIKKYYEEHKAEYKIPAKVKIRHILQDTKNRAEDIKAKLDKGEDFINLAKSESTHDATKNNGGYIGWVAQNNSIPYLGNVSEITDVIFKLAKNDITEPIKSAMGYHIIKIEDMKPEEYRSLDQVKNQISDALMVSEADIEKYYNDHLDEYKQDARIKISHIQFETKDTADKVRKELIDGASFIELAKVHSTDKSSANSGGSVGYVKKNGYIRGIGKDTAITDELFKLEEENLSSVFQSKKGYHVFKINEKEPERQKSLEEVKTLVRNQLLRESKELNMNRSFDNLKKKYKCTVNYDELEDSPESEIEQDNQGMPALFPGR